MDLTLIHSCSFATIQCPIKCFILLLTMSLGAKIRSFLRDSDVWYSTLTHDIEFISKKSKLFPFRQNFPYISQTNIDLASR